MRAIPCATSLCLIARQAALNVANYHECPGSADFHGLFHHSMAPPPIRARQRNDKDMTPGEY
jgi:hypothetical protein